jgi:uncharacterized phiE125 gp8 family phage protein
MGQPIPGPGLVVEPVTEAELREWVRQDLAVEAAVLTGNIVAARRWLEAATDRALVIADWEWRLPGFPGPRIELPYPPLKAVVSVKFLDASAALQTLAPATYVVVVSSIPGRIDLATGQSWPQTAIHPEAVTITYTAGGAADDLAKLIIKLLAAHWYEHREATSMGGNPAEVPPGIQALAWALAAHRF